MTLNSKKLAAAAAMLTLGGCMVGPKYQQPPPPPVPAAFKEPPPDGWKSAQPSDGTIRGKWWEIYNDPDLNALEEQVNISNQNVLAAEAQFRSARESIRIARSALFPTVTAGASASNFRGSSPTTGGSGTGNSITFPTIGASYTADVWGAIRRSVQASVETAQATAAQLENAKLVYQSDLAQDYFSLHGLDGDEDLLERTAKSYQVYLDLTKNRYAGGIASGGDVAQAETQLDTTQAQLIDLGVQRAQYEHAIAILIGKAPAALTIPRKILKDPPPVTPVALPSVLLERRPDVAALERTMASSNEQIGIAQAAYYPTIGLSASAGLEGSSLLNLFSWPARFWSIGPTVAETIFDAGKRNATVKQAQDNFDVTVANYRAGVLTAFQQVEDNLAALTILEKESAAQDLAVKAAERSLTIATDQYKAGTTDYLTVITTQAIALQNERTAIDLLTRRLTSSVGLVQALGGGWDSTMLPSATGLRAYK